MLPDLGNALQFGGVSTPRSADKIVSLSFEPTASWGDATPWGDLWDFSHNFVWSQPADPTITPQKREEYGDDLSVLSHGLEHPDDAEEIEFLLDASHDLNFAVSTIADTTAGASISERRPRRRERSAKPIPKRFVSNGRVRLQPSTIQCLSVTVDYLGYTGKITQILLNMNISNFACMQHDELAQQIKCSELLFEPHQPQNCRLIGHAPQRMRGSARRESITLVSGILQRKQHVREIPQLLDSTSYLEYVRSPRFHPDWPYEPQYYRYELDLQGHRVNESKCGLCSFCREVKFLPFKNSSYLSHMTLEHGIFANHFVVPEGLYYGNYVVPRPGDSLRSKTIKALQCPACFQVIEVSCWKRKKNPLLLYFRHYKKHHLNLTKTFVRSTVDELGRADVGV